MEHSSHIETLDNTLTQNEKTIKEGQAEILLTTKKVFYNPVQEFNRDLSIAVLTVFGEEYKEAKIKKAIQKSKDELEQKNEVCLFL